jgi:hypothetical protein
MGKAKVKTGAPAGWSQLSLFDAPPIVPSMTPSQTSGGVGTDAHEWCPGCLHRPLPDCAACGKRAAVCLDAGGGCSMSLCESCHGVVREWRAEHTSAPLCYVSLRGRGTSKGRRQQASQPARPRRRAHDPAIGAA